MDIPDLYENTPGGVLWVLLAFAALLASFAAAYVLLDRRARRRILEERWDLFRRMVKDRGLSREEVGYLRRLQQRTVPDRPHVLVTSLNYYDSAVENEMHRLEVEGASFDERSNVANAFINVREKLFFGETVAKVMVSSTLDLAPGQHLRVEVAGKDGTWESQVLSVNDSSVTITMPTRRNQLAELNRGDRLVAYFSIRNDAGYRFETGVAGIREGKMPVAHLWHTERMERQQHRTWMRMSVEIPVRFYRVTFPDIPEASADTTPLPEVPPDKYSTALHDQLFTGLMRDFSLGGVCVRTEAALKRGGYVGVLIPLFSGESEDPTEELEILGRVVGVTALDTVRNRLFNVHVQFVPLDEGTRSLLMANMFQLQRRLGKKAKS